ncbi:hypothetical protein P5673_016313 [Acropora cervicornis]|uniref:Uncharacterized protein n=1 Tax=Acropora cervicornis TaxID=6130 RepID=A0AAD9V4P6_ACRCE|nr:hypothetical protein P5673_016313 [Acropora cervicornis]
MDQHTKVDVTLKGIVKNVIASFNCKVLFHQCQQLRRAKKAQKQRGKKITKVREKMIHSIDFMIVFKVNMDFTAFY